MLVTVYTSSLISALSQFSSFYLASSCHETANAHVFVSLFLRHSQSIPDPRLKLSLVVTFSYKRSRYSPRNAQSVSNISLLGNKPHQYNFSSPSNVRCFVRFVLNGLTWCGSKLGSGINFKSCPYECSKQKHFWGQAAAKVRKTTGKIWISFSWKKIVVGSILVG